MFLKFSVIHNGLMMLQMLLLSIWAWRLYSVPPSKISERIQHVKVVAVLEENNVPASPEIRSIKDGVENKCFTIEKRD